MDSAFSSQRHKKGEGACEEKVTAASTALVGRHYQPHRHTPPWAISTIFAPNWPAIFEDSGTEEAVKFAARQGA